MINSSAPASTSPRRGFFHACARVSLAVLAYSVLGASSTPTSAVVARLQLDREVYFPGSIPTLCFTSEGYPRQEYFIGDQFDAFLDISLSADANGTSPFASYYIGKFGIFQSIEIQLDEITCNSQDLYIQGFVEDPRTGQLVEFTNEVVMRVDKSTCDPNDAPGGQGCGVGFWKNQANFDKWPIPLLRSNQFADIFDNAFPGKTLIRVLRTGGGSLNALGRQAVAALLNAQSPLVDFDLSPDEVVEVFNQAYPGTPRQYTDAANLLQAFNQQGCD